MTFAFNLFRKRDFPSQSPVREVVVPCSFSYGGRSGRLADRYDLHRFRVYLPRLEALLDDSGSEVIKDYGGTRTAVVSLDLGQGNERFVLKAFRRRSGFARLRSFLGRSRAERIWNMSNRLLAFGIRTPRPVAVIVEKVRGLLMREYYLSAFLEEACNLKLCVRRSGGKILEDGRLFQSLGRAIGCMHDRGLIHGDLKWSNILLTETEEGRTPWFVDLDHARARKKASLSKRARDLARFLTDMEEEGVGTRWSKIFLDAYWDTAGIPGGRRRRFLDRLNRSTGKILSRHRNRG